MKRTMNSLGLMLLAGIMTLPSSFATSTDVNVNVSNVFVNVSRKLIPSVVNIFTASSPKPSWREGGRGGPNSQDEMLRRFFEDFFNGGQGGMDQFGMQPMDPGQKARSLGSGFIVEVNGNTAYILTNHHVVDGADSVRVKFTEMANEKETDAEVVGLDPDLDLALLKVKTKKKLQAISFGDSDKLEEGEWIAAIGNPFGHGHSVSHGIISAKERSLPGFFSKYLQVDAPINPGNSGGPLVNLAGEVVGINNAIDARGPGIGFAIPINQVKMVLNQLKSSGRVERGYVGVNVDELRPDLAKSLKLDQCVVAPIITHVVPGQPADKAGLKAYDVITEVSGKEVHTPSDLIQQITNVKVGDKVKLKALRSGKEKVFEVVVGARPDFRGSRGLQKPQGKKPLLKPSRMDVGMQLEAIDADTAAELGLPESYEGLVVAQVAPGGAAHLAGLMRGDVILDVAGKPVKTEDDFYKIVNAKKTYPIRVRKQDSQGAEVVTIVTLKLAKND